MFSLVLYSVLFMHVHTVRLIKKFTFRNHDNPYLAYVYIVSTIQVPITLEEST